MRGQVIAQGRRTIFTLLMLVAAVLVIIAWRGTAESDEQRQQRMNYALISASQHDDDAVAITNLLREGANPNACEQPDTLRERLERNYPKMYPVLRHLGRDDGGPRVYCSALAWTVSLGNIHEVKALLAGGASVQQKDSTGQTVLALAEDSAGAKEEPVDRDGWPGMHNNGDEIFLMLKEAARNPANSKGCACR